ncbi:MAG: lipid IV(A) 3-deoxy-D-manno-octulosonic acid transferase [Methylococcales bacterium]|nr:lipid IV(A) 3-deoxy-D-manno-octulosonic acid transferase [Methylobacter sp.]MDP2426582.1 lipid IV(A) 3-deoxy-D-manno-octulosonic acid transferase [Methylobacter sp.]MDP3056747.1 lipid IV(A) 3-deoxy-D-manno-octulosonic acid transferase [Methylobacter sp.]MDP3362595.1 lipid IV(A) 3-deoxy-D-manno-octulosonic acid transferase [Methylobacter sp.]MDZ4157921.1 lipid IV(A) 3-deoxy-D-manno-octulosonic acid transferase [Methylococcales bacterium]
MKFFYSCLFYLLIPSIIARLLWRSIKAPAYRHRWRERFACYTKKSVQDVIWFHAVSVGEAEALFPLARKIQRQYPEVTLLITTTTPTGSARVRTVMQGSAVHVYLPYDIPCAVGRFMRHFRPKVAVIMETEIWPNLFAYCGSHGIPLYIINARLSEKSARGYQKIPALIVPALAQVKLIAAQTQDDAGRFVAIGAKAEKVNVQGNIKFDVEIPSGLISQGRQLKTGAFRGRFVWLVASTHKDEEAIFFGVYKIIKQKIPGLLLVVAPRHPERFVEVKKLAWQHQLAVVTRTSGEACETRTDVYLADTMGELKMLYAAVDVAFVGGSMVPVGGHNILEAAVVGVPVLFGPYMANFKDIAEQVLQRNAAIQCRNDDEIIGAIIALHADSAQRQLLAQNGKAFVQENQGAMAKIFDLLALDM